MSLGMTEAKGSRMRMVVRVALVLAASVFLVAPCATWGAPVEIDLDFMGPAPNSIDMTATANGTTTTSMNGKIVKFFTGDPNPQTDAIRLDPETTLGGTSPAALPTNETGGASTTRLTIDDATWTPLSIRELNLDLINGTPLDFNFATLILEARSTPPGFFDPVSYIAVDVHAQLQQARFYQTGGTAFFGLGNTYAIPGKVVGAINVGYDVNAFDALEVEINDLGPQTFEWETTLTGVLAVETLSPAFARLSFDGLLNEEFILDELSTIFTVNSVGAVANMTLDVNGGIALSFDYHLEDYAGVPEPGTLSLLGLGLLWLIPRWYRRRRRSAA